jgi:hypothetical protein
VHLIHSQLVLMTRKQKKNPLRYKAVAQKMHSSP